MEKNVCGLIPYSLKISTQTTVTKKIDAENVWLEDNLNERSRLDVINRFRENEFNQKTVKKNQEKTDEETSFIFTENDIFKKKADYWR